MAACLLGSSYPHIPLMAPGYLQITLMSSSRICIHSCHAMTSTGSLNSYLGEHSKSLNSERSLGPKLL